MSEEYSDTKFTLKVNQTSILKEDEIISFCQLLSTALRTGLPLTTSLGILNNSSSESLSSKWANDISELLKKGYSVEEYTEKLKEMDPVIVRLLPLLGNNRLIKVFEIYTKFIIKQETCCKQIRCLVWYPLLIMALAFGVVLYLNFVTFPVMDSMVELSGFFNTWSLKLLYFSNIFYWPFSLIIPLLLLLLIIDCSKYMFTGHFFAHSLWANITGISEATRLNEKSRFAALIYLYLEAGYSLNEALEVSLNLLESDQKREILGFNQALIEGNSLSEILYKSGLMAEIISGKESSDELPLKFKYAYDAFSSDTVVKIKSISDKLFYIPLIIAGLMVLAVASGLFGSYSLLAWSV